MAKQMSIAFLVLLAAVGSYMAFRSLAARMDSDDPDHPLAIKWEGAVIDRNFRDAGASLESCLGRPLLRAETVYRANVWFSGWSCDGVGSPDVIYSLNFDPEREEQYFCQTDGAPLVGRHFNSVRLNDLEFVETWDKEDQRSGVCGFFRDGLESLAQGKRILVHCDAGKDRTGTAVALLAGLAAEVDGPLDEATLEAIECDYRRSDTLEKDKYGRMRALLETVQARGGVGRFLADKCGIDPSVIEAAARRLRAGG